MRTCAPCRLCCKIFPVPALDKPGDEWCRHICPAGCSIHSAASRPPVCRQYTCFWLDHDEMPHDCRPDLAGFLATESGTIRVGDYAIPVCVVNRDEPSLPPASSAITWLESMASGGWILLVIRGLDLQIAYDRSRYVGLTEDQIEDAYRRVRQEDAEELKQLGAVGEDFDLNPPPSREPSDLLRFPSS
jgi:hypothetical protein